MLDCLADICDRADRALLVSLCRRCAGGSRTQPRRYSEDTGDLSRTEGLKTGGLAYPESPPNKR